MNLSFIIMKVTHLLSWYKKLHRYLSACEKIESGGKNLQVQQQHMWWSFLVQRRNMWDIYVDYILSNNILNKTMDHIIINVKILLYHLIEYNPFLSVLWPWKNFPGYVTFILKQAEHLALYDLHVTFLTTDIGSWAWDHTHSFSFHQCLLVQSLFMCSQALWVQRTSHYMYALEIHNYVA